jgi:hypothetical protein
MSVEPSEQESRIPGNDVNAKAHSTERSNPGGFDGLAGDAFADFDRLVCPNGDWAWPLLDAGDPEPPPEMCRRCGAVLEFRSPGWRPHAG